MQTLFFTKRAFFIAAMVVVLLPGMAVAQQPTLNTAQIDLIRQNCLSAQVTLQRVQHSDVVVRINRGQAYDALLTKLMAPFNSRVALNRLDHASLLTEKTTALETKLAEFKQHYVDYEDILSDTLSIKCQDRPVAFYDMLTSTRQLREALNTDIGQLENAMKAYTTVVTNLQKTVEKSNGAIE